jgi:hypothetical protein
MKCTFTEDCKETKIRFKPGEFKRWDMPICLKCAIAILMTVNQLRPSEIELLLILSRENNEDREYLKNYTQMMEVAREDSFKLLMNDPRLLKAYFEERK